MKKKQQDSPASETSVAADQLPAAEILAGELVSVVARNVESGRLSEHAISQAWATALAPARDHTAYIARHRVNENHGDPLTPCALSRWLLWGESRSLARNTAAFRRRFRLQ